VGGAGAGAPGGAPQGGANSAFAGALHDALGQVWQNQIAPYYPFNRGAAQDVDPAVLKSFLGPGGQFWTALTSTGIAQGVDETGASIAPNAGGVPADIIQCIKRAYEIRKALFSAGDPGMKVLVEPEQVDPAAGAPSIDWVSLGIGGGQPYRYDATGFAAEQALDWPGNIADQGAALSMMAGSHPIALPGTWGLFRLLDKASCSDAGGQVKAVWTIPTARSSARVTWKFRVANVPRNPFSRDFFTSFKVP
jgi:type VI protein secretion system component VasK